MSKDEVMRYTYFGGIRHDMRQFVWPYLLGYYHVSDNEDDRVKIDEFAKINYEEIMTQWLAVEVIVKQVHTGT